MVLEYPLHFADAGIYALFTLGQGDAIPNSDWTLYGRRKPLGSKKQEILFKILSE